MSNKTRKRFLPVALVMAVAAISVVALALALTATPRELQAHGSSAGDCSTEIGRQIHDALSPNDPCPTPTPDPTTPPPVDPPAEEAGSLKSTSTSASATVQLTLTITDLRMDMEGGSSVVLYLEDDFQVPDNIDRDTVYFTASNPSTDATWNGGRVYATDPIEIETDDHVTDDKDDYDIRVLIPDMNTGDAHDGFNGPEQGQTLTLVFTKAAGIKNPSEAHDSTNAYTSGYQTGYTVLGPTASVPHLKSDDATSLNNLFVHAKIGVSDVDNDRGYELTVTGSGFNNGTSAAAHVLYDPAIGGVPDDAAAEAALCSRIIREGHRAGIATVGSDDKVAVTFEVTVPIFGPGNHNYICMVDGEGRASVSDVEDFKLLDSLRVVPSSANAGDVINIFAQDFPPDSGGLQELKIANTVVWTPTMSRSDANYVSTKRDGINDDGSGTITFELPGSINNVPLEGTVRIDVKYGSTSEDGKITITGSALRLSQGEVRANDSITIQGEGFGGQSTIDPADITMDGVALHVDNDSLDDGVVKVSNAGQFVATVAIWRDGDSGDNPSLISGTHTIRVKDSDGFFGTASIVIKEPTIKVLPLVAGPRDVITITGENWPVDNPDGGNVDSVEIEIDDDPNRIARRYTAIPDLTGRFTFEHRVSRDVGIPSNNQIKVTYGENSEIVKISSFDVPESIIEVSPAEAQPGEMISLSVSGMPVYTNVYSIEVGGRNVLGGQNFSTDRTGAVTSEVIVPGLDPGTYSVIMEVGEEEHLTIAIGEVEVLSEGAIGTEVTAAEGLANLGDNLVAVFHFNNAAKEWSFYDPRPEFADLNTLDNMVQGEAYWILIAEDVDEVVLNNKVRSLTCRGDDCWNLEVW